MNDSNWETVAKIIAEQEAPKYHGYLEKPKSNSENKNKSKRQES